MAIEDLTIKEARELAAMFGGGNTPYERLAEEGQPVLAILQRGWVYYGIYSQRGNIAKLTGASVVRRWGTTNGLGELAEKGPTSNTRLDACPPVSFHIREAVGIMECCNAWGK